MRKWLSRTLAGVLTCASLMSVAACGGGNPYGDNGGTGGGSSASAEKVLDPTKTQLQVKTFRAGFGDEWLYELEARFEEAYKDVSYEDDKMGVQVWHDGDMKDYTAQDIISGSYDIYFTEGGDYYSIVNSGLGALEELTDIVVNPNKDDNNTTLLSKLTAQQKEFYGVTGTDGDPKYYAIPHYEGGWGLIYNKDLFDREKYYVTDTGEILVNVPDGKKGTGPDGVTGTSDDGLPRTYEEFFLLCDEIALRGDTPVCWSGTYAEHYLTALMNTLVAEYEGLEQMSLNLSFNGEAKDLVVIDENNQVVYENGEIKTEPVSVTSATGYEISRQAGKYYALKFLHTLMTANENYYNDRAYDPTHTHYDAQSDFLKAGTKFQSGKEVAMLVDGPWWEAEALTTINLMGAQDPAYSRTNRNFGWMPLPKATEEKVGSGNIYIDTLSAYVCVKAGLGPKKQAALDFVRFSITNDSLVEFTQVTGAMKAYNYTLTAEESSSLSPFTKSLIEYKNNSTTFVMDTGNEFYLSNRTNLRMPNNYPISGYKNPVLAFSQTNPIDGETYFENMYKYWKVSSIWE